MSAISMTNNALTSPKGSAFLDYIRGDLDLVECMLEQEITSDVLKVQSLGGHVLSAGGKRLRPALVALGARAVAPDMPSNRITLVGASVELVHMATLVHDDVVDSTTTRRGKPTANAIFGNGVAVLTGDFLLARAVRLLATDGDMRIIRTATDITMEMSEGEVMEILATGKPELSLDHYYQILRKKTAIFIEGCCRCGAMLAGATEQQEEALAKYGYHLGMAFQVADDLLDYTGDPAVTGKPVGSDLRSGRATLPFLLAMNELPTAERDLLLAAFGNHELDDEQVTEIVNVLEGCGVFERTRKVALDHIDSANCAAQPLAWTPARDSLLQLSDYVVHRDK